MESIQKLLYDLENEISSEKFIKLYETIRERHPIVKPFPAPKDLISCLHNQDKPDYALNDKILLSLILEYQNEADTKLIGPYLLIIFKPGLMRLFHLFKERAKQLPSLSEDDLWLQIITLFFEELSHIDPVKDSEKIASKIVGRIRHSLRDYFRDLFKSAYAESDLRVNPKLISSSPAKIDPAEINTLLQHLADIGVISETDKHILLATKVYGKSMKELSEEYGELSYEAIRQRKARVEKTIWKYFKKSS